MIPKQIIIYFSLMSFLLVLVGHGGERWTEAGPGFYIATTGLIFLTLLLHTVTSEAYRYQTYDSSDNLEDMTETQWLNQEVTPDYSQMAYSADPGIGWTSYQ